MHSHRQSILVTAATLLIVVSMLVGCGATATPTTAPTVAPTTAATKAATAAATAQPTKAPPTAVPATATPQGPTVGGTIVYAISADPSTLDPQMNLTSGGYVWEYLGATLITVDPATGKFVPWLAESWTVSADGLTYDFVLRKGVKFHDGTPLTAQEMAWTFSRALDPATKSTNTGPALSMLKSAEAVSDYALRLTLKQPMYPILAVLCNVQPMCKEAVEKAGTQIARAPVAVGPYKFKEWVTGSKIVIERNPDFNWYPPFVKGGPYIQTIEFRVIGEQATIEAGLENGEIDASVGVPAADVTRLKATGKVNFFENVFTGPYFVQLNVTQAPFTDVRVRKAFALAINRAPIITAVYQEKAVVLHVPISPSQTGYSPDLEKLGYDFDLAQAKALMKDAGYTIGSDGYFAKDGQQLKVVFLVGSDREAWVKAAEIIQQQWKALGVFVELRMKDGSSVVSDLLAGNFMILAVNAGGTDMNLVANYWGATKAGGMDFSRGNDAKLDDLLIATRTALTADQRQVAITAAMKYFEDNVISIPLYAPISFVAVSSRIKGAMAVSVANAQDCVWLWTGYIAK